MKKTLLRCCAALALAASLPALAEDAVGSWTGLIDGSLRLNIHISKSASGALEATLESPEQSSASFKVDHVAATPTQLSFTIARFKGSFDGKWDASAKAWSGTWSQGGQAPLTLTRLDARVLAALAPKRPQEEAIARDAAPYTSSEVSFANTRAGIDFAATLTLPQGKGPFPAVVLVHGSGPNNRDEDIFGHKVFLVLADHLSKQGIAVLRYDKRGVAGSRGDYKAATSFDFADDAQAAVAYLRTRAELDQARIGMIGHSEGGLIAPLVAARDPKLAFIVLMAGPGIRGDILLLEQERLIAMAHGASQKDLDTKARLGRAQFAILNAGLDDAGTAARLTALLAQAEKDGDLPPGTAELQVATLLKPWYRTFVTYDPAPALRKVTQPVLALNGELDLQVPSKLNLDGIRAALSHNRKLHVQELPKLNHAFQTAVTGSPSEYRKIEETVAPVALEAMSRWIQQQ